ncbi:PQQ-binding-like beta-propeller repeat protein [Mycobacterium sp. DL440]|uniref:outer membrane protein assembly factor BamB family protein n=1 Tax=Mycobacterium sp. DL440 TaxID=2675523 RepID=UPI00142454EC|nr:PQQ-binding-like beta-propeller repeat protein [Mycobacterium sp. DL440]
MVSEGAQKVAGRVLGVLRRAGTVLAGAAAVWLVWAVVLGAWARLVAPRSTGESAWYVFNLHRWGAALPNRMALAVTVIAVVLIAAMVYSVWRGRTDRDLAATPAGAAGVAAVLVIAYVSQGIPAFYHRVMDSAPVTTALPLGTAAWWLCLAGAAATFLAARAFPRLERGSVKLLAVGAAIAIVVAAVVTVGALRAGDDARFVDATTAAATDVPGVPTALGKRTFTVSVPDAFAERDVSVYDIDSAGAGFAVYQKGRITAYGTDGKERWHYARTGPGDVGVNGMRVVDSGATVLAFIDGGLVGLDATTGEQLWTSGDADLHDAARGRFRLATGPFIVGWNDERVWTRYDGRTGHALWSVPAPHPGCGIVEPVVAASGVVSTVQCEDGKVWLSVLDPETGEIGWDTVLSEEKIDPAVPIEQRYLKLGARPANGIGVFISLLGSGAPDSALYADIVHRTVTALPADGRFAESYGPSDDFVVWYLDDRTTRLTLFGPDGHQRCQVPDGVEPVRTTVPSQRVDQPAYVAFPDSLVLADRGARGATGSLRTFDAKTCAQTATVPAESVEGLVPAPGAVLVLRRDGQTLQIDGYTA